jgi:hypothetical protein
LISTPSRISIFISSTFGSFLATKVNIWDGI